MVFLWFSRSFQLSTWFKAAESPDVPPRVRARPGWRPTCHSNPLRHLRRCGPMWIIIMFSEWIVYLNIYIYMYVCMHGCMYVLYMSIYIYLKKNLSVYYLTAKSSFQISLTFHVKYNYHWLSYFPHQSTKFKENFQPHTTYCYVWFFTLIYIFMVYRQFSEVSKCRN